MRKMFIGRFAASILALLIASSVSHTRGQSQSSVLSDENEAEILESLLQLEIKRLGSELRNIRTFSSANISTVSVTRIAKLGFSFIEARDTQRWQIDHNTPSLSMVEGYGRDIEYVVVRTIHLREGVVVVKLSAVTEGRPCFAPAFFRERSFTYEFKKIAKEWVGRIVWSVPFPFSRSSATTP